MAAERTRRVLEAPANLRVVAWHGAPLRGGGVTARIEIRALAQVFETGTGPALLEISEPDLAVPTRWAHANLRPWHAPDHGPGCHHAELLEPSDASGFLVFSPDFRSVRVGDALILSGREVFHFEFQTADGRGLTRMMKPTGEKS